MWFLVSTQTANPSTAANVTYVIGSGLDLLVESVLVLVPEGRVPHQQDVENDTCKDKHNTGCHTDSRALSHTRPRRGDWLLGDPDGMCHPLRSPAGWGGGVLRAQVTSVTPAFRATHASASLP